MNPLLRYLYFDGQRAGFSLHYAPDLLEGFRNTFREHRGTWNSPTKCWIVPKGEVDEVIAELEELDPQQLPATRAEAFWSKAQGHPQPFLAPHLDLQIQALNDGRQAIHAAYDPVLVALLRKLRGEWQKPWWILDLPQQRLQEILARQAAIPIEYQTVQEGLWELLDSGTIRPSGNLKTRGSQDFPRAGDDALSRAPGDAVLVPALQPLTLFPVDTESLRAQSERYALYPHQQEGLHFLLARSTALLADDMGLGKTRQALVAALTLLDAAPDDPAARVLIVCPASLKRNWQAELEAIGVPDTVIDRPETRAQARAIEQDPAAIRFVIVNYELLRVLQGSYRLAIFDEAHYLKEPSAQRTQEAFRLAQRIPRRWLLTATPVLNREEELWTLLRLGGHPLGSASLVDFRALYAGDPEQRSLLHQRVQEWLLRRRKSEVLSLPGKYHRTLPVEPDPDWWDTYRTIEGNADLLVLPKIKQLLQQVERGKREAVLDLLDSLQETDKALVFCQYRESVHWFLERLGDTALSLTGALSQKARDRAVRRFQEDATIRYLVATIDTGGIGLNLTAASYVFFVSRPWTPAAQDQAEDRAYRIGQNRRVEIYLPTIPQSIDERIAALLDNKREVSEGVLGEWVAHR